jgi:hypothetical protein
MGAYYLKSLNSIFKNKILMIIMTILKNYMHLIDIFFHKKYFQFSNVFNTFYYMVKDGFEIKTCVLIMWL